MGSPKLKPGYYDITLIPSDTLSFTQLTYHQLTIISSPPTMPHNMLVRRPPIRSQQSPDYCNRPPRHFP